MEAVMIFLSLMAGVLAYANMREARTHCDQLLDLRVFDEGQLAERRYTLLLWSSVVAGVLVIAVLFSLPAKQAAAVPGPDRILAMVVTTAVTYSQLLEQWALRQHARLMPARQRDQTRR